MPETSRYSFGEDPNKKRLVIADISESAEAQARDVSADKMTETPEAGDQPKGWKKFFSAKFWKETGKRIWKHNLAEDYYRTKYQKQAEKQILSSGNLYANEEGVDKKQAHQEAVRAITQRFATSREFEDDFIHKAAGESRTELGNEGNDKVIKDHIIGLIKAYARGDTITTREQFDAEKNIIFGQLRNLKPDSVSKGKMFADNMFEIAQWAKEQVAQAADHELALRQLDSNFEFVVGKAKAGVRTEAQFNAIDKIVDVIQRHTGGVFNEATVAAVVAGTYSLGKKIVQGSVRRAASFFGLGMAAMGATAAAKESRKLEMQRSQHAREMAQGRKVKDQTGAPLRAELEQSRVQFRKASDLEENLQNTALYSKELKDISQAEYAQALQAVAEIEARIHISDRGILNKEVNKVRFINRNKRYGVDLIGYSDLTKVAQEQDRLDRLRAQAKVNLKKWAENFGGRNFANDLQQAVQAKETQLMQGDQGVIQQNEKFTALKRQKVWKAFKKGAIWGGIWGAAFQEIRSAFDSDLHGIVGDAWEHLRGHAHTQAAGEHTTLLEGMFRRGKEIWQGHYPSGTHAAELLPSTGGVAGILHEEIFNGHHFKLPDGFDMRPDGHGGYQMFDHDTAVSESFQLNSDGSLSDHAKEILRHGGFNFNDGLEHARSIQGLDVEETKKMFPDLARHARVDWHDNPGAEEAWFKGSMKLLQFEGKQQQLFLEQGADGHVFVDLNKMMHNLMSNVTDENIKAHPELFGLNDDGTIDQQLHDLKANIEQALASGELQKHLQVAIIPTEGANHAGLSDLITGANEHGKIALTEQWEKLFSGTKDLHDGHLPVRFIEARYDGHVLATAQGVSEHLSVPVTEVLPPHEVASPVDFVTEPPSPIFVERGRPLGGTKRVLQGDPGRTATQLETAGSAPRTAEVTAGAVGGSVARAETTAPVVSRTGAASGGGSGGPATPETGRPIAAPAETTSKGAKAKKARTIGKKDAVPAGTFAGGEKTSGKKRERPKAGATEVKEAREDESLVAFIKEFNEGENNKWPHIIIEYEEAYLVPPKAAGTRRFLENLIKALRNPENKLQNNQQFKNNIVKLEFRTTGPRDAYNYRGMRVLPYNPNNVRVNEIIGETFQDLEKISSSTQPQQGQRQRPDRGRGGNRGPQPAPERPERPAA